MNKSHLKNHAEQSFEMDQEFVRRTFQQREAMGFGTAEEAIERHLDWIRGRYLNALSLNRFPRGIPEEITLNNEEIIR